MIKISEAAKEAALYLHPYGKKTISRAIAESRIQQAIDEATATITAERDALKEELLSVREEVRNTWRTASSGSYVTPYEVQQICDKLNYRFRFSNTPCIITVGDQFIVIDEMGRVFDLDYTCREE